MMKIIILKPDASLTTSLSGTKKIAKPMATPVTIIGQCGVSYFSWTRSSAGGSNLSWPMAYKNLEEARIPASAIEIMARTEIIAATMPNSVPTTSFANT